MNDEKQILILGSSKRKLATFVNSKLGQIQKGNSSEADLLSLNLGDRETLVISVRPDLDPILQKMPKIKAFDKKEAASIFKIEGLYLQIGADRLANLIGAIGLSAGLPVAVLDFGTCTTYTSLAYNPQTKTYQLDDGFICPGIGMALHSLHWLTASLPQVTELQFIEYCLSEARNCLANSAVGGVCQGVLQQTLALLEKIESRHLGSESCLVLTGGWSQLISSWLNNKATVLEPNLVFLGAERFLRQTKNFEPNL
jgi:pantothenate kinase type III